MRASLLIILAGLAAVAKSHSIKSYDSDATVLLGKCTTERVDQCPLDFPESWATVPGNPRKETFLTGRESPCRTFKSAFRARDLKICPCTSCDCEECKDVAFQSCVVAPKGIEWKAICPNRWLGVMRIAPDRRQAKSWPGDEYDGGKGYERLTEFPALDSRSPRVLAPVAPPNFALEMP